MINEFMDKKNILDTIITIISIGFLFLFLFYNVIIQNDQTDILVIIGFVFITAFSLLGYFLILNEPVTNVIKKNSKQNKNLLTLSILFIPILLLLVFLIILYVEPLLNPNIIDISIEMVKYAIFILFPIFSVIIFLTNKIQGNYLYKLISGSVVIYWVWWSIEFNGDFFSIQDLVVDSSFFQLLAITLSAWIFLILIGSDVPRSFTGLFKLETFKIIIIWLLILFILIIPAGLLTSFLVLDLSVISEQFIEKIIAIPLTFIGIFLLIALIEEFLFRGLIYQWTLNQVSELSQKLQEYIIIIFFVFLTLIFLFTPFLGLADPIETGIVKDIPLEIIYPLVGLIYFTIGLIFYYKTKNLTLTMLLWSSMLFGWAHFEDWRYIIFATIAGIGYCDTYRRTNNIFASTVVHASVNTIWGIFLT
ncbi:MAG: CPBP family glutamic-type intramembrane protease [Candidatus Hodarchaeales archaeon]|jgi:membrane protease YdiL (CAAX protease family)